MDDISRKMFERNLGSLILEHIEPSTLAGIIPAVNRESAELLIQICTILDTEELDDFDCVEAIVDLLAQHGIDTFRHDSG